MRRLYIWWRLNTSLGVWRFRYARWKHRDSIRAARTFNRNMQLPPARVDVFGDGPDWERISLTLNAHLELGGEIDAKVIQAAWEDAI